MFRFSRTHRFVSNACLHPSDCRSNAGASIKSVIWTRHFTTIQTSSRRQRNPTTTADYRVRRHGALICIHIHRIRRHKPHAELAHVQVGRLRRFVALQQCGVVINLIMVCSLHASNLYSMPTAAAAFSSVASFCSSAAVVSASAANACRAPQLFPPSLCTPSRAWRGRTMHDVAWWRREAAGEGVGVSVPLSGEARGQF